MRALALLAILLQQDPLAAGRKALAAGDFETAVASFTRALDADPAAVAAVAGRAEAHDRLGESEKAVADWSRAIELKPAAEFLARRALSKMRSSGGRDAESDVEEALRIDPKCAAAHVGRAQIAMTQGDIEAAKESVLLALGHDPKSADAYYVRALLHGASGNDPGSKRDLDLAIECDPLHVEARFARAVTLSRGGNAPGALKDLDELVRLRPKSDTFLALRGDVKAAAKDPEGAVVDLTRAIELNPGSAELYLRRAGLYTGSLKKQEEAIRDFSKVIQLDPDNGGALTGRGYAYARLKDFKAAGKDLARAYEREPDDPWGAYNLACYHGLRAAELKGGDRAKAVDAAFDWLKEARGAGYLLQNCGCHGSNLQHLRTDGDLAPLHDDPRWNAASAPPEGDEDD